MVGFVAVHLGAGTYSKSHSSMYEDLASEACAAALDALRSGKDAVEAVARAVEVLEDSPLTNAGTGSNLTLKGEVECDASLMTAEKSIFGAVGAVKSVKNPVRVAAELVRLQAEGNLSCGRIPPSFLVGSEAAEWAGANGIPLARKEELITRGSQRMFETYSKRVANASNSVPNCDGKDRMKPKALVVEVQDTVGALCLDSNWNLACASSSGGIALKQPGRIGPAACYGSGIWCQTLERGPEELSAAVCASGSGEYLMRTLISEKACTRLLNESGSQEPLNEACEEPLPGSTLSDAVDSLFRNSPLLRGIPDEDKLIGLLAAEVSRKQKSVTLTLCHSTRNMCIGFGSLDFSKPHSFISVLPIEKVEGESTMVWGKTIHLREKKKGD